MKATSAKFKTL